MTQGNSSTSNLIIAAPLGRRMVIGAAIAFILILVFVLSADGVKPEWGRFWMIRPLLVVPFAGAMGGVVYHLLDHISREGKLNKTLAVILSIVIYIIGLWFGSVLGLDGTYWD